MSQGSIAELTEVKSEEYDEREDAWFNATLQLKDVDLQRESFTVKGFFNIYWATSSNYIELREHQDDEKLNSLELALKQLQKGEKRLDLLPFMKKADNSDFKAIMSKTPIIASNGLDWFFFNSINPPQIKRFKMQYYPNYKKSRLEIMFVADFAETFELEDFPFDAQFLNIKLKLKVFKYKFLSGKVVPNNFLEGVQLQERNAANSFHHERPLSVAIRQPIDKEWELLKPWLDLRINKNTLFCLVRLRVRRKASRYVWNNIFPLILITGLSFIYIAIEDQASKLAFIVTLLLTIAAGNVTCILFISRQISQMQIVYIQISSIVH